MPCHVFVPKENVPGAKVAKCYQPNLSFATDVLLLEVFTPIIHDSYLDQCNRLVGALDQFLLHDCYTLPHSKWLSPSTTPPKIDVLNLFKLTQLLQLTPQYSATVELPSTKLEAAAELHLTTKFVAPNLLEFDIHR